MSKVFRILSIDGGGIRGILPARVMTEIEERTGLPISKLFDLIAGTSTGGVLALGATIPDPNNPGQPLYPAKKGVELYEQEGHRIFDLSTWRKIRTLGNIADEKYSASGIEGLLRETFGEAHLHEALTDVVITSYEIERRTPWFFRSSKARSNPDYDFPMWQVARATSAAPTYFEPCKIEVGGTEHYYALVDGAVFANNPTMCALVEAKVAHPDYTDFLVVSLGTGQASRPLPYNDAKDWGLVKWVQPIMDILIHGVGDTVDYQMRQMLPELDGNEYYYRFDTQLNNDTDDMDDASPRNIRALGLVAEKVISENDRALTRLCNQLKTLATPPTT